jgi:hypothetical protein
MKTAGSLTVTVPYMVAVVRKMRTGDEGGSLTDNFVSLDHRPGSIRIFYHPLPAKQGNRAIRAIMNRQVIDKRVGPIGWEVITAVAINELI